MELGMALDVFLISVRHRHTAADIMAYLTGGCHFKSDIQVQKSHCSRPSESLFKNHLVLSVLNFQRIYDSQFNSSFVS